MRSPSAPHVKVSSLVRQAPSASLLVRVGVFHADVPVADDALSGRSSTLSTHPIPSPCPSPLQGQVQLMNLQALNYEDRKTTDQIPTCWAVILALSCALLLHSWEPWKLSLFSSCICSCKSLRAQLHLHFAVAPFLHFPTTVRLVPSLGHTVCCLQKHAHAEPSTPLSFNQPFPLIEIRLLPFGVVYCSILDPFRLSRPSLPDSQAVPPSATFTFAPEASPRIPCTTPDKHLLRLQSLRFVHSIEPVLQQHYPFVNLSKVSPVCNITASERRPQCSCDPACVQSIASLGLSHAVCDILIIKQQHIIFNLR